MPRSLFITCILLIACDSDKGVTAFNSKPEASITSHSDDDEVREGFLVTLRGSASDANHRYDELFATWYAGSEILCPETVPESDGIVQCETTQLQSDSEVILEVRDVGNATGSDSVFLTVVPTEGPEARIIKPEGSGVYYSDQLITFEAQISDEEDSAEVLVASWESSLDGVLGDVDTTPELDGSLLGHGYLTEGEHAIELSVEDTTGKTDRASVIIEVGPPNSAPLCDIIEPLDGAAGPEGSAIQIVATASDVDVSSDVLTVTWSSDKDGVLGESTPTSEGEINFSYSDLSVNQHNITMTVADEVGATCTTAINYTVGTPPSIVIVAPGEGEVINEGESISFTSMVSDAQDQPDEVSLDWSLNGTSVSTQGATSSGSAEFSDSSLAFGPYNLVVTATDTDGLTDADQINFTVNGRPSQPLIELSPDPANTNDDLTVSIALPSTDPEGSIVNYSYEWLMGGAVQSAFTSSTVPSSATHKNEQWTVRVIPNDGLADGTVGEASITIANSPPTLSALAIVPTINVTNDITLSCSVLVTDPDETLMPSFEWLIGSSMVGNGTTLDLSSSGAMPDDVVTCLASVVDGDGATASLSTTTTIQNRPPSVIGTVITPSTGVTTSSALTCVATVADDDGESPNVTYEWLVGNSIYTGDTLNLNNALVSPGDSVDCVVTAHDGFGGTSSDSASVIIENTLPTVTANISVNGGHNAGELTCSAIAADIDDTPSIPSLDFEWFDAAGVSLGTSNPLQLDSSMGVDGDVITCVASATDLSGDTVSDTATHTITNTPPVIDSIVLTPSTIDASTNTIGCTVIGSDSDGDPVTFSYAWYVDGVLQSTVTSNTFLQNWIPNTEIVCRATPNDGKEDGFYSEVSAVVDNTPPEVDSVILNPPMLTTNDTLTATAVMSDPDVTHAVTGRYEWHVIDFVSGLDSEVQSGADNTLSGVTHFDRDDEVYVIVTPNDGIEDGLPVTSSSITVSNSNPSAPTVSITPNPAVVTDDLLCAVDVPSTDVDGDSIVYTYVWTDASGMNPQTTVSVAALSDTLLSQNISEGNWTCEVTPFDGSNSGMSVSATTEVTNNCSSLYFDQSSNLEVIDSAGLALSEVSLSLWVHPFSTDYGVWVSKKGRGYGGHHAYNLLQDNGAFRLRLQIANCYACNDSLHFIDIRGGTVIPYRWHHLAATYDATTGTGSLYVNGVLVASETKGSGLAYYTTTEPLNFGSDHYTNVYEGFAFGLANAIQIFDEPLLDTDIVDLSQLIGIQTAPVLSYTGTQSNTEILDQSGNGFDGYVMGVTDFDGCPEEDLDGDGVSAWEDCDDNDSTIVAGTGTDQTCPATSCKTILDDGYSTGDGMYWVDPDGLGALEVYCDMTNDGGGWTLLVQGGASCQSHSCSTHTMTNLLSLQPGDSCAYLDDITVSRLASVGTDVILRSGTAFGVWSTSAMSTNSLAVEALQVPGANWHNGATWDNWDWNHPNSPACATGWPNMFHADGNAGGVHWIVGDGISYTWGPAPSTISTGWVR